ncbi:DsbA family protein [Candidatus Woesearchaeota archaeon]|nr:DsbA family protein [Candidatus Woesearchaeota archaeon]
MIEHDKMHHKAKGETESIVKIKSEEEETFKIKKTTLWQGLSAVLGVLLAVSIFTGGFGYGNGSEGSVAVREPVAAQPSAPSPTPTVDVQIGDAPALGDENAPVTLIEFSDFQCPFCGRHFSQTHSQIKQQYIDTGKVRFVYKHFPLDSIHPQATPAALASECAREQGKFWEYHDLIFQNQQSLGDASYKQWASQLSLDTNKFNGCYDSQKYIERVRSDLQQGTDAGVRGTPGFLLNGVAISGAQPFDVFQQAIEAALSG